MYKIDLLKGRGIPSKAQPLHVVIAAAVGLISVATALFMVGSYCKNHVVGRSLAAKLASYDAHGNDLIRVAQIMSDKQTERQKINNQLAEVSKVIKTHMQWSPIIAAILENLPNSVALNSLALSRHVRQERVERPDDQGGPITVATYQYVLEIETICDIGAPGNRAVQKFIDRLRASAAMVSKLEDIRVMSKQSKSSDNDDDLSRYDIECVFKKIM